MTDDNEKRFDAEYETASLYELSILYRQQQVAVDVLLAIIDTVHGEGGTWGDVCDAVAPVAGLSPEYLRGKVERRYNLYVDSV